MCAHLFKQTFRWNKYKKMSYVFQTPIILSPINVKILFAHNLQIMHIIKFSVVLPTSFFHTLIALPSTTFCDAVIIMICGYGIFLFLSFRVLISKVQTKIVLWLHHFSISNFYNLKIKYGDKTSPGNHICFIRFLFRIKFIAVLQGKTIALFMEILNPFYLNVRFTK